MPVLFGGVRMQEPYEPLKKLFYKDPSAERFSRNKELARERLAADTSFRTGVMLDEGELFCAVPRELSLASERIMLQEREVVALWEALPYVARGAFLRSLILNELQSSNEIEGVHSTRRDIQDAIDAATSRSGARHAPFVEFAQLYLGLSDGNTRLPASAEDIRHIYDAVTQGTIAPQDAPDGRLFRRGPVHVTNGVKSVHDGVLPEDKIVLMLNQLIALAESPLIPSLYSAVLSHLLFEYVHPFYDGNGRTGRYLLSLYLSRSLSLPTVLSVSRAIAEDKGSYYRAFVEALHPLNNAEGTFFVLTILGMIERAQLGLADTLREEGTRARYAEEAASKAALDVSTRAREVLKLACQFHCFASDQRVWAKDVEGYLACGSATARKYLRELEAAGLLAQVSARPLSFALTEAAQVLFSVPVL